MSFLLSNLITALHLTPIFTTREKINFPETGKLHASFFIAHTRNQNPFPKSCYPKLIHRNQKGERRKRNPQFLPFLLRKLLPVTPKNRKHSTPHPLPYPLQKNPQMGFRNITPGVEIPFYRFSGSLHF
ncbi:hypothetical protein CEXT_8451 [Caerostris extrusa]|uniref:Uncharacterized protein n=1 Tax=Caerostris extrusa TaxID=172846 RepID=A0AAV4NCS7_CAEEX|nr:hypothetical protein CEXT_8451 [Caerostris extrusa]